MQECDISVAIRSRAGTLCPVAYAHHRQSRQRTITGVRVNRFYSRRVSTVTRTQ